jgi:hypothetical protein
MYLDEDALDLRLVATLKKRGIDLQTCREVRMEGAPDEAQLHFAMERGRTIYTFNVGDFCRLHIHSIEGKWSHAGIIVAPLQRLSIGEQATRLLRLIGTLSAEDMKNRLEFLSSWG